MNKKTFNPSEWLNKADNTPATKPEIKADATGIQADIETVTRRIEEACKDITVDYAPWRNLGFALADALGEYGRSYYHRLSRFNPDYNQEECDKQYTAFLNAHGHGITIKTFFQLAKDHGISVSVSSKTSKPAVPSGTISEGSTQTIPSAIPAEGMEGTEETEGPTITDTLPYPLPDFLQKVIARKKSTEDADLLLLGALAVISACLPGISGEYDELVFYPNFFLFVTGSAPASRPSSPARPARSRTSSQTPKMAYSADSSSTAFPPALPGTTSLPRAATAALTSTLPTWDPNSSTSTQNSRMLKASSSPLPKSSRTSSTPSLKSSSMIPSSAAMSISSPPSAAWAL